MRQYCFVVVLMIVILGLSACGRPADNEGDLGRSSIVSPCPADDSVGIEYELIERTEDEEKYKDFVRPQGEVLFCELKGVSEKACIVEYEDEETCEFKECRVPLDVKEQEKLPDMDIGDKLVVFYEGTIMGEMPGKVETVYAIYLQENVPHIERYVDHEIMFLSETRDVGEHGVDGCFMDMDGRMYSFDFTGKGSFVPQEMEDRAALYRSLEKIRKTTEPDKVLDESLVKQICEMGSQIDSAADYYGYYEGECSTESYYIRFCYPETGEEVTLYYSGYDICWLEDENAKKILRMYYDKQIF